MTKLHLDFETASRFDLLKGGLDLYSKHPSTRALMLGWAVDDGPANIWLPTEKAPSELKDALTDPKVLLFAHNAQFERIIFKEVLKARIAMERWRCTQIMCYYAGLPGGLGDACAAIGLPTDTAKNLDGRRLIRKFCAPRKPTKNKPFEWHTAETDPEDWALFIEYCRQDIIAEREIARKLAKFAPPDFVWEEYRLDQKINDAGMPVDRQMAINAVEMASAFKTKGVRALAQRTGLANPMSQAQALPWLRDRGYPYGDLRKQSVARAEALSPNPMTPEAQEVISVRSEMNKASIKKFDAILSRLADDDRLRFNFQFIGAMRTGRWAGRAVQLQNLARPKKEHESILHELRDALKDMDEPELTLLGGHNLLGILSSLLRPVFCAPVGKKLRVADLASIEDRKVAWLSGCETILEEHRRGMDPYKAFGTHLYNKPYDEITKKERNDSKPGRLGACYRLSGGKMGKNKAGDDIKTGLWGYAESMGIALTQGESAAAVSAYRNAYPEIVQHWYALEKAAIKAIRHRTSVKVGKVVFEFKAPYLLCHLPSGRALHYLRPKVEEKEFEGPTGRYTKTAISYEGQDPDTKKWGRIYTHGGKLVENICQASARDVLMHGMILADADGFEIVGHVHDEIITVVDADDCYHTVERLEELMSIAPAWCADLPLGAAGYESDFYRKD